jgi:hypothetical protein
MEFFAAGGYTTSTTVLSANTQAVALDGSGNVMAGTSFSGLIEIFRDGGYTKTKTLLTDTDPQPAGVAVDGSGNVFVVEPNTDVIKEVLAAGGYTTVNLLGAGLGFDSNGPLAVDVNGNIFIASGSGGTVEEIYRQQEAIPQPKFWPMAWPLIPTV